MKAEDFVPEVLDEFAMVQAATLLQAEAALSRMGGVHNREAQRKLIDTLKHGLDFVMFNRRELGL